MTGAMATCLGCGAEPSPPEVTLAVTGQALIKLDPRIVAETPFATVQPIVAAADVAFTNFEMAVNGEANPCGVPDDYVTITGSPDIPRSLRPGNTDAPHAVSPVVMQYLAGMGFDLMSLANNHAWDLGECGIRETIAAAHENGLAIAGTGTTMEAALAPAYLEAGGITFALVASTTSRDERELLLDNVNGVWLGHQADWDRNLEAVREAAANADFVIYYQHLQLERWRFRRGRSRRAKRGWSLSRARSRGMAGGIRRGDNRRRCVPLPGRWPSGVRWSRLVPRAPDRTSIRRARVSRDARPGGLLRRIRVLGPRWSADRGGATR